MTDRIDLVQGTLDVLVLQALSTMGPLHGYGIACRLEQTSNGHVQLNQGTVYAALVRLQRARFITAAWGTSDNNRRAKYYHLTKAGARHLEAETRQWRRLADVMNQMLSARPEDAQ